MARVSIAPGAGGITEGSLLLPITDCSDYESLEFSISGAPVGFGVIEVQQSHRADFALHESVAARRISKGEAIIGNNPNGQYLCAVGARYVRIIVTAPYLSGTCTCEVFGIELGGGGGGGTPDGATATLQTAGNASLASIASATGKVSAANTPAIITASGNVAAANAARKSIKIQNWGTNPLFVRLGTGASATVAHEIAAGGTTNDDGKGGSVFTDQYTGVVSVFGTGVRCVVTEL